MISGHGWVAVFRHNPDGEDSDPKTKGHTSEEAVVAWNEDGQGLIVDAGSSSTKGRRLIAADSYPNFAYYQQTDESEFGPSAVIAAQPNWWVVHKNTDENNDSEAWWFRIIAWIVKSGGFGLEAVSSPDAAGIVNPDKPSETRQFVYDAERTEEGAGLWPIR